jgi:hypothetical protein
MEDKSMMIEGFRVAARTATPFCYLAILTAGIAAAATLGDVCSPSSVAAPCNDVLPSLG